MSRFTSLVALLAIVVVTTSGVMIDASAPPTERLYTTQDSCGIDAPIGDPKPYYPCFSCMNLPTTSGPTTLPTFAPTNNNTATPTASPTINSFPVKSIYTHCFLDKDSVYTIYFQDQDCEGSITLDVLNDDTCPDCTGCKSTSDCGTSSCPGKCCGFAPECARCQNAGLCSTYPDECEGCPGCSNPNPYCDSICTDSEVCSLVGSMCNGCLGCNNPPDPCKSCVSELYCGYGYREQYCNNGNCPTCAGVDPCSNCAYSYICSSYPSFCGNGTCAICQAPGDSIENDDSDNAEESIGRMLSEIEMFKAKTAPKIELPDVEYLTHERVLDGSSSSNFTSYAQSMVPAYDSSFTLALASLYTNSTCLKASTVGSLPIQVNKCQDIPAEADNQTLAIKFTCSFGPTVEVTVNGYSSIQDCENDSVDITFSTTAPDGSCVPAPSDKWALTIQCAGWGQVPPTPSPPVPGPNDVAFGTRVRYPDRRCLSGTGETIGGSIVPCDICAAFPNRDYKIYSCADSEVTTYSNPDCSGLSSTNNVENCDGLGPIRGIFSFEKIYRPANGSIAFFSSHVGLKGCWAENVESFIGVESDVCSEIKPPKGSPSEALSTFIKARCDANIIDVYMTTGCAGQAIISIPFTDHSCIALPGDQGFMRASCSGYQTPLPAPPTPAPTNSPTYAPTYAPTYDPTKAPTTSNPTRSPIKAPTNSPTAPTAPTTQLPSNAPSKSPTATTTSNPTNAPATSQPTTSKPSKAPTSKTSSTDSPTSGSIATIEVNYIIHVLVAILTMMIAFQ